MPNPSKTFLPLLLSLMLFSGAFAQSDKDTLDAKNVRYAADIHYHNQDFDLALTEYLKLYNKVDTANTEVNQLIADCYISLGNKPYSAKFLKKVIDDGQKSARNLYYYSDALRHSYQLEDYKKWSLEYTAAFQKLPGSTKLPVPPNWKKDLSHDSLAFKVKKMQWNGAGTDLSPVPLKYGWLFPSAGPDAETGGALKVWYGDGKYEEGPKDPFKIKGKISKRLTDGAIAFDPATNEVFFTGEGKAMEGAATQLYTGNWSRTKNKVLKVKALSFGAGAYAHPALIGKQLYFASNRPGGQGGWDIWRVYRQEDGSWGEPENLGPAVNGPDDEMYPYILPDRTLFLSSNRKGGLGGMDLYVVKPRAGDQFMGMEALPFPFNTTADEIAFTAPHGREYFTNLGGFSGFVTSNREGNWDVFSIRKQAKFLGRAQITRNKKPIPNALLLIESPDGGACLTRADQQGHFHFYMDSPTGYKVRMTHPEFSNYSNTNFKIESERVAFSTQQLEYYDLSLWVYDKMNLKKLVDADVEIITNDKDTVHYTLDTLAKFMIELEPGNAYKVKVSHPGYFDWTTRFTAYKKSRKTNNSTIEMKRMIGTLVRGKLDAPKGTDFSNTAILPFLDGKAAEPLAPSVVKPDGSYEIFLPKDQDQKFKLYVTLDDVLSGVLEVETNQNNTRELTDTVDMFIDVKRATRGMVLFSFPYNEDPVPLGAGVYPEMKEALALLEAFPLMKLEFTAHTETRRPAAEARTYSQEAAEFGADYYHYLEIPKERVVARGYGGTQPLINCRTQKCSELEQRKNRRIEIRVLDTGK